MGVGGSKATERCRTEREIIAKLQELLLPLMALLKELDDAELKKARR